MLAQAYKLATKRGYETIGIACEKAVDFDLFPVSKIAIIIGKNWGDESSVFLKGWREMENIDPVKARLYDDKFCFYSGLDAMIRIGSGSQSIRETNFIREMGKLTYEYDLPKIE